MKYTYKMVQVPPTITVSQKEHKGNEAAFYLETIVNKRAEQGWEYYRIDSIGVNVEAGCSGSMSGKKDEQYQYYVITFRRPAE